MSTELEDTKNAKPFSLGVCQGPCGRTLYDGESHMEWYTNCCGNRYKTSAVVCVPCARLPQFKESYCSNHGCSMASRPVAPVETNFQVDPLLARLAIPAARPKSTFRY